MRRVSIVLQWLLCITAIVHAAESPSSRSKGRIAKFLESVGIDPAEIDIPHRTEGNATFACAILDATNNSDVVFPNDGQIYTEEANAHASSTARKRPRCICTPRSTNGVVLAVRVAAFLKTRFAVRSGGHSPMVGFANIDDGFLLSMNVITDLEYNSKSQTLTSGFGNRWLDIYDYLQPLGRVVVGGRAPTVGLALATGGGLSHLSNLYGWASQNTISYRMVLGNGTVVTASERQNSDLYFAVKAGSNNYGFVTHITQHTYPLGRVWGGVMVFPGNQSTEFMGAMSDFQRSGQLDRKAAILPYISTVGDVIIAQLVYLEGRARPAAFAPFYSITTLQSNLRFYDSFRDFVAAPATAELERYTYGVTTILHDKQAYQDVIGIVDRYRAAIQSIPSLDVVLMPQPISISMVRESIKRGPDPMGVTAKPQLWLGVTCDAWNRPADDAKVGRLLVDIIADIGRYSKTRGLYDKFLFLNDAHSSQKPLQGYGSNTFETLKATSLKWDPQRVFQRLVPGGFKLG
ncbi:hypothetical protein NW762_006365 [Fusarium torreyae]|uniref:FAD-binding PCMH-type domain-containing protein n=1 Tax=Fusarium torreyae TaxID=1237075 RepID=A0A9W8S1V9_9HYPO|nr:hypothetical protein NW762_006365 [Fusarium torreyae]